AKLNPNIAALGQTMQQNTDREILDSAEYHMERIRKEAGTDLVSRVQVGEALPEASAMVTAKITQSMGRKYGKDLFTPAFEEIENDASIRLNTQARQQYLDGVRAEALKATDDPFYVNGVMEGLESQIAQNEQRWTMETAKYQKDIVKETYQDEVSDLIDNGGDLLAWDAMAKQTGPFKDSERNAIVLDTYINKAVEAKSPEMLNNIPTRFLNAKAKRDVTVAQSQIRNATYAEWSQNRTMAEETRKQNLRSTKVQIIQEHLDNGTVDARKYRNDPEAFAYALAMSKSEGIDKTTSVVNAERIKNGVLKAAISGDVDGALGSLGFTGDLTEDGLYNFILGSNNLNSAEKQALAKAVPDLLEGQVLLKNPMIKSEIDNYLAPALNNLRKSPNAEIQALLDGTTVETQVMSAFEDEILMQTSAYYSEHGSFPKSFTLNGMVREARRNSLEVLKELTQVSNIGTTTSEAQKTVQDRKSNVLVVKGIDENGLPIYE
ncbi:hypothetical protein LCGC14_2304140, partial [marine sediment metagenome]